MGNGRRSRTIPRFGDKPTNANVYIGTENTITDERYEEALAKAVDIRLKAERAYQARSSRRSRKILPSPLAVSSQVSGSSGKAASTISRL